MNTESNAENATPPSIPPVTPLDTTLQTSAHPRFADDDDLDAVLTQCKAANMSVYVMLARYSDALGDWEQLQRVGPAQCQYDALRSSYGAGRFRADIRNAKGQRIKQITFTLGPAPAGSPAPAPAPAPQVIEVHTPAPAAPIAPAPSKFGEMTIADVLNMLERQNEISRRAAEERIAADRAFQLELAKLNRGTSSQNTGVEEALRLMDAIEKRVERKAAVGGDGPATFFKEAVGGFLQAAQARRETTTAATPRVVAPAPAPSPASTAAAPAAAPPVAPAAPSEVERLRVILNHAAPFMLAMSKKDKDAVSMANVVANAIEAEELDGWVRANIGALPEGSLATMVESSDARFAGSRDFLINVEKELREYFTTDDTDDEDNDAR
ncbi:MAG: hypothetical protein K2X32_06910 [Phycisphaerales bacterium]|nr:hypothetical protein [Phycisphaerales bacterium]